MCHPAVFVAQALSSAGGAAQGYEAQRKTARRQTTLIGHQTAASYRDIAKRRLEEREVTAQNLANAQRQARLAVGAAATQAGEGGVAGNSVNALIGDVLAQEGRNIDAIRRGQEFRDSQLRRQEQGVALNASGQLLNLGSPSFPLSQILGSGLQAGASYANYQNNKNG